MIFILTIVIKQLTFQAIISTLCYISFFYYIINQYYYIFILSTIYTIYESYLCLPILIQSTILIKDTMYFPAL